MPAPGALILLAAVSASGCLASPAHPGESVGPSCCPVSPTPTLACPGVCLRGSGSVTCVASSRSEPGPGEAQEWCLCQQGLWEEGWGLGGEGVRSGNMCVCRRARVCVQVCAGSRGRSGPLGELGTERRNTISKGDIALEAVSGFGGVPRLAELPTGPGAGDRGHVCAPSVPKSDRPQPP